MLLFGLLAAERMKRPCLLAYPRAKFFAKKAQQRFSYAVATMKMPANSQIVSHISHKNLCFRYLQLLRRTGYNRELSKLSDLAWNSLHKFTCTDLNIRELHSNIREFVHFRIMFKD